MADRTRGLAGLVARQPEARMTWLAALLVLVAVVALTLEVAAVWRQWQGACRGSAQKISGLRGPANPAAVAREIGQQTEFRAAAAD